MLNRRILIQVLANQKAEMGALQNLNDNITALEAQWTKFLADLTTVLAGTNSEAAVQAAADLVAQQTAAIASEDTTIG